MKKQPSSSVLEYVLKLKKLEVANYEAISQALAFEKELEEWNAEKEKEEEMEGREG